VLLQRNPPRYLAATEVNALEKRRYRPDRSFRANARSFSMFKRARISLSIALIAATCGFLGLLDSPIAQTLFDFLLAFAFLSFLFGLFEDRQVDSRVRDSAALQTRRITGPEPQRVTP